MEISIKGLSYTGSFTTKAHLSDSIIYVPMKSLYLFPSRLCRSQWRPVERKCENLFIINVISFPFIPFKTSLSFCAIINLASTKADGNENDTGELLTSFV